MIEQVFWSTVDKLDVIDHISLTDFMVSIIICYRYNDNKYCW